MSLENLDEAAAMDIVNNTANEFHQRLYEGDSLVKTAVEKAFARANPERDESIRNDQQFAAWSGVQTGGTITEKSAEWDRAIANWRAQQAEAADTTQTANPSRDFDTWAESTGKEPADLPAAGGAWLS